MARYIWVIDQVCSVKIAGYWPSSFFLRVNEPRRSRGPKTRKKKNEANVQPYLYGYNSTRDWIGC